MLSSFRKWGKCTAWATMPTPPTGTAVAKAGDCNDWPFLRTGESTSRPAAPIWLGGRSSCRASKLLGRRDTLVPQPARQECLAYPPIEMLGRSLALPMALVSANQTNYASALRSLYSYLSDLAPRIGTPYLTRSLRLPYR